MMDSEDESSILRRWRNTVHNAAPPDAPPIAHGRSAGGDSKLQSAKDADVKDSIEVLAAGLGIDSDSGEKDKRRIARRKVVDLAIRRNDTILVRWLTGKFKDQETARDIAQSAYVRVLRFAENEEIDNPQALLFKTAANLAANEFRSRSRLRPVFRKDVDGVELDIMETIPSDLPSPERATEAKQDLAISLEAIERLPQKVRRAFVLSRFEEKSYREIAVDLQVSESSVEKYIITALKALRDAVAVKDTTRKVVRFPIKKR